MSTLKEVLVSAAELQRQVPGTVLLGGTAVAVHADHRLSTDHDHVVGDLAERFDAVLSHLESLADWSTARVQPPKLIRGSLGGIETGIRQLRRSRPLEVESMVVDDHQLVVPTLEEMVRIKGWLALTRDQTRDYLDLAALADRIGVAKAGAVLARMDEYYSDLYPGEDRAASQMARQLADPQPRDRETTQRLGEYRNLDPRWNSWETISGVCGDVALAMLEAEPES